MPSSRPRPRTSPISAVAALHLVQALERVRADARGVLDQVFALDHLERRQRRGGGDRVLLVRVVAERVVAGDVEVVARDAGGDRQHAAAERLAEHHDVGRGAVVLGGEEAAGLAQAGRDLVEDQQRAVRVAGLAHRLPVARRRDVRHGARRLGDHRGHVAFALEHVAHHRARRRAGTASRSRLAVGVDRVAVGAAVAAERRDVLAARQQRADGAPVAEERLAADARRAEARAVERVPEAQRLEAAGGDARELDRDLDRVAAAGREQHAARRCR